MPGARLLWEVFLLNGIVNEAFGWALLVGVRVRYTFLAHFTHILYAKSTLSEMREWRGSFLDFKYRKIMQITTNADVLTAPCFIIISDFETVQAVIPGPCGLHVVMRTLTWSYICSVWSVPHDFLPMRSSPVCEYKSFSNLVDFPRPRFVARGSGVKHVYFTAMWDEEEKPSVSSLLACMLMISFLTSIPLQGGI